MGAVETVVREAPRVRGLPLIGSAVALLRDPLAAFVAGYLEHGPIFRMRLAHRRVTVLAGPEANLFLTRGGMRHLASGETYKRMFKEFGSRNLVNGLDGEAHQHLRRLLRPGYSRELVECNLPRLAEALEGYVRSLGAGRVTVRGLMQRPITEQLTLAALGRSAGAAVDDAAHFSATLIAVNFGSALPLRLRGRRYRESKARLFALAAQILEERRAPGAKVDPDRAPDLVDVLAVARNVDGSPFSPADITVGLLGPFIAGMDTAASVAAFLLYELLRQPALLEAAIGEAEEAFAGGPPSAQRLRQMRTLRGALLETMRLHPIAVCLPRRAVTPFEFEGCRIEAGEEVWAAPTVVHFLPRFYPEPERFDIARFEEPRREDRQPGAFAAYGLGPHVCLGAGQAELVSLLAVATLLRAARVSIDPANYKVRSVMAPLTAPDAGFAVRLEPREAAARPRTGSRDDVTWVLPTLDRKLLAEVAGRVEVRSHPRGEAILRQGDAADRFYMILDGEVAVEQRAGDGPARVVRTLGRGEYFGEIGLLTGAPRNATVRAAGDGGVVLMSLDRESFLTMIMECDLTSQELARVMRQRVIANQITVVLPWLDARRADALAPHVEQRRHAAGEVIIRQGDAADHFYFLVRGACEVTCSQPDGRELTVGGLVAGDFFGEAGLLLGVPRTATVRATADGEVEVLALGREGFATLMADAHLTHEEVARVMRRRLDAHAPATPA